MTVKRGPMTKKSIASSSKFPSAQKNTGSTIIPPTPSAAPPPDVEPASSHVSNNSSSFDSSNFDSGGDVALESNAEEEEMRMLREQSNKISVRLVLSSLLVPVC